MYDKVVTKIDRKSKTQISKISAYESSCERIVGNQLNCMDT